MAWFRVFVMVSLALLPLELWADPNVARERFLRCQERLDEGQPCRALEACEAGLEAMDLSNIRALRDRARAACVKETRERREARRAERMASQVCEVVGQTRTPATQGQCCWPGQRWEAEVGCVGAPTSCPPAHAARGDRCERVPCPEGKVYADETHCCWPEQEWFDSRGRCLGIPQCPAGLTAEGEGCVPVIPDQDQDGLADQDDLCPTAREDDDNFEDDDGCPEYDNDGDQICDALIASQVGADASGVFDDLVCRGSDGCPMEPEDADGFEDGDGCPDPDNDGDGLLDGEDTCPDTWGVAEHGGCPPPPDYTLAILGWSGVGLGTALVISGTALVLSTLDDRERLNNPQVSVDDTDIVLSLTESEAEALHESIRRKDTAAIITFSIGGASLLAGGAMLLLDALGEEEGRPEAGVSLRPSLLRGGAGLELFGRF